MKYFLKTNAIKSIVVLLCLVPFLMGNTTTSKVEFFGGSLNSAKAQAGIEGKLFFVDFYANWCAPCNIMDETTFKDPSLAWYIKQNYIPLKVNVEDFDGFALKQQYNVKVLPTILIFNSEGEVVGRYEEAMSASRMIGELKKYNTPENRIKNGVPPPVVAPPVEEVPKEEPVKEEKVEPIKAPIPEPRIPDPLPEPEKPAPVPEKPMSPVEETATPAPSPSVDASSLGLYRFSVNKQASAGFGVQIGVFAQYGNVLREVEKLEAQFSKPVLVNISTVDTKMETKTVYKVIVGAFATRDEALGFQGQMKAAGVNGIIKDLSSM